MDQSEQTEENKQNDGDKKVEKERLCEYYVSPRGCIKGDKCDFLHPKSPNGSVTNRVCDYYNQNRGCIKENTCDFLHVHPRGFANSLPPMGMGGMGGMGMGMGRPFGGRSSIVPYTPSPMRGGYGMNINRATGGMSNGNNNNNSNNIDDKQCKYFFTSRGCIKGDKCDFSHSSNVPSHYPSFHSSSHHSSQQFSQFRQPFQSEPYVSQRLRGSSRPLRPKKCEFHNTERGCVKGDQCDFIHEKNQVCDFFNTSRGCRKGELCDFQHTNKDGNKASSDGPVSSSSSSSKKRFQPYSRD